MKLSQYYKKYKKRKIVYNSTKNNNITYYIFWYANIFRIFIKIEERSIMKDKVLEIFIEVTGNDEIAEDFDLNLFDAGLLDSLAIIEVLLQIEEKLGIKLQPTDLEREDMSTVNKLTEFLQNR